jgi:hypothetical protein
MNYHIAQIVVYSKTKHSAHPGPRAKEVHPAERGDDYAYVVDKFWKIIGLTETSVKLVTRQGKEHCVDVNDPCLRKLRWWEKIIYRNKVNF